MSLRLAQGPAAGSVMERLCFPPPLQLFFSLTFSQPLPASGTCLQTLRPKFAGVPSTCAGVGGLRARWPTCPSSVERSGRDQGLPPLGPVWAGLSRGVPNPPTALRASPLLGCGRRCLAPPVCGSPGLHNGRGRAKPETLEGRAPAQLPSGSRTAGSRRPPLLRAESPAPQRPALSRG